MISEEVAQKLLRFHASESSYAPTDAVRENLAAKTLIMLVGPSCVGKSTIMEAVCELSDEIKVVHTGTSRPPRSDDHTERYHYITYTDEGLAPLFTQIEQNELVQYAVNPHNLQIYWSTPTDYPSTINVGDYFSSVVDNFRSYGFRRILVCSLTTPSNIWLERIQERFASDQHELEARLAEATTSISWSLAQGTADHVFVANDSTPQATATSVISVLRGEIPDQIHARSLAEKCLQKIQGLLHEN